MKDCEQYQANSLYNLGCNSIDVDINSKTVGF